MPAACRSDLTASGSEFQADIAAGVPRKIARKFFIDLSYELLPQLGERT
jgi:hypothetical protein